MGRGLRTLVKRLAAVVQVAAAAILCGFYIVVAGFAIAQGVEAVTSRSSFATPASEASAMFVVAALAAVAVAVLIASIPLPVRRCVARTAVLVTVAAGVSGLGAAAAVGVGAEPCEEFRFDPGRWRAVLDRPDSQVGFPRPSGSPVRWCAAVRSRERATRRCSDCSGSNRRTN